MMVPMGDLAGDVTVRVEGLESDRPFGVPVVMVEQELAPAVKYAACARGWTFATYAVYWIRQGTETDDWDDDEW